MNKELELTKIALDKAERLIYEMGNHFEDRESFDAAMNELNAFRQTLSVNLTLRADHLNILLEVITDAKSQASTAILQGKAIHLKTLIEKSL